ncbi:cytochrome P450 [Ilumatobacter sp.]|uniref:cytochrome P450 n=1 Tax=Ilumatobacter sp. TaxID=1967498 RepID=UPI003C407E60
MADQRAVDDSMSLDEVDFFDPAINDCPYHAYRALRDEAPVWFDERLKAWVITRHEDVLAVLRDTERFNNSKRRNAMRPDVQALYEEKGWLPARTLAGRDDPNHKEMRRLFDHAFRPKKLRALEPQIDGLAHQLIDDFIDAGECDWVQQFAVPLPLIVIGMQMGADPVDIWKIKGWTDAWVQRLGLMQTSEEVIWSTEMEIEAQHYFQPIFERLREQPDDTLLSDLVNTEIPEWGRCLNDEELHAEMMADTFVGGSETTTNALSGGVRLLIEHPDQWEILRSDPDTYLPVLVEEVLRLESPVQRLMRTAAVDVELHGVQIPAGSMLLIGYSAANRDDRVFDAPARFDLERADAKKHVSFGFGTHFCLGAPLARRELLLGFTALVQRIDEMWFLDDTDLTIAPNYFLRALKELKIGFRARS